MTEGSEECTCGCPLHLRTLLIFVYKMEGRREDPPTCFDGGVAVGRGGGGNSARGGRVGDRGAERQGVS